MTAYTITWEPDADDGLAEAYNLALDRSAVAVASADVEKLLATNPYALARKMSEGLCRVVVGPLAVYFSVDDAVRHVTVSGVGLFQ